MTDKSKLTSHEISHPLSILMSEPNDRLGFLSTEPKDPSAMLRINQLSKNALYEITTWSEAIGHLAYQASTHPEADKKTIEALGVGAEMLGLLSHLGDTLIVIQANINYATRSETPMLDQDNTDNEKKVH